MPSSGAVNVADVEVVPTSQFTHPDPALYWTVYVAMSVTPVSGAHVTVKDIEFLYCGRAFTWEPGARVSIMVHVLFAVGAGGVLPARSFAVVADFGCALEAASSRKWPDCV